MTLKINIANKVGKGYKEFWNFKGRYRVVKGSRGSKKSTTISMWIIYNMMKYPLSNTLVVRKRIFHHIVNNPHGYCCRFFAPSATFYYSVSTFKVPKFLIAFTNFFSNVNLQVHLHLQILLVGLYWLLLFQ